MKKSTPNSGNLKFTPPHAELHVLTVAELLKKGKEAPHVELGRTLAAIATFYSAQGSVPVKFQTANAINVPVPIEFLALVVQALGGSLVSGREEPRPCRGRTSSQRTAAAPS
jgi:hypothetical protein